MDNEHSFSVQMVPTPPPKIVPFYPDSAEAGLPAYFRIRRISDDTRCSCCGKQEPKGAIMLWVPDDVKPGMSTSAIIEIARCNAYNGYFSLWCVSCVKEKLPSSKPQVDKPGPPAKTLASSLTRLWRWIALKGM